MMAEDRTKPATRRPSRRKAPAVAIADEAGDEALSHNLQGQRLGRKGRDTRERIMAAAERLLSAPGTSPISLSAVAREASLAMPTLYLYFNDLSELLVAVLEPVLASSEEAYVAALRERWPDERLHEYCVDFVSSYFRFWAENISMIQLRERFSDKQDLRMIRYRIQVSREMIELLVRQMDGELGDPGSQDHSMATVLWTSIERLFTVIRDVERPEMQKSGVALDVKNVVLAEARLLELGIREARRINAARRQAA